MGAVPANQRARQSPEMGRELSEIICKAQHATLSAFG